MFRIGKDMEGRYCSILLQGIPVIEIKVKSVTDDEILGDYGDGEEVWINNAMILAYWPDKAKDLQARKREAKKKAKTAQDSA